MRIKIFLHLFLTVCATKEPHAAKMPHTRLRYIQTEKNELKALVTCLNHS